MLMLKHPNVKRTWPTIKMEGNKITKVLLVETDLVLAPDDPDFDEDAVNGLLSALGKYLKRAGYDGAEIIPSR